MSTSPSNSTTPSVSTSDPESGSNAGADAAIGAAAGAATGIGLWGLAMPVANMIGFGTAGIASGSTAASMMSAAAIANGGGVASGSAVAIMQSIGAVGLATPVGLGLVAGGAAVGSTAFLVKSRLSRSSPNEGEVGVDESKKDGDDKEKDRWVLVEISPDSGKPQLCFFDDDYKARNAFINFSATSKALFDPEQKIVLELGWDESLNGVVGGID